MDFSETLKKDWEEVMKNIENSHRWVDSINPIDITLYPIQFANCDRLQKNDAVFIFDEVGSGKTISSGLMALDYLYQNQDKDVLVVTANALVKTDASHQYGQFLRDWYEKLPFQMLELDSKVKIVNQHYSKFSKNQKVGLMIIDEAHLFLSTDTKRYENLVQNIRADKVVFLTATPIKSGTDDLYTYVNIARKITEKDIDDFWINEINTDHKEPHEIICSRFDPTYPVTRYFKDTIMSLNEKGFCKTKARRLLPEMWIYDGLQNKQDTMLKHINHALGANTKSRFVIFTRFVEQEAYAIASFLCKHGFSEFDSKNMQATRTVKVVTGQNAYILEQFKGHTGLPTVLILTYQIAEQGVNLPGFNYVVNYHISAYPSALEQRFGRIDRMGKNGSVFDEIHMSFLIDKNGWDSNTLNFHSAVSIYMRDLLSYLPSKNTMLSPEIIEQFKAEKGLVESYVTGLREHLKDNTQVNAIQIYYQSNEYQKDEARKHCNEELLSFIDKYGIEIDSEKKFVQDIRDRLSELVSDFKKINAHDIDVCLDIINKISDNIFYGNVMTEEGIKSVDAVEDCGKSISECDAFKIYNETFNRAIKVVLVLKEISPWINRHFEQYFMNNQFDKLFPLLGYEEILREIFTATEEFHREFPDVDKDMVTLICERGEVTVKSLPFFKMCDYFKKTIQGYLWTNEGNYRQKFDFNPFECAVRAVGFRIAAQEDCMKPSPQFVGAYWPELNQGMEDWWMPNIRTYFDLFCFQPETNGITQISSWYKLAYQYLRRESQYFEKINGVWECRHGETNTFLCREQKLSSLSKAFISCGKDEAVYAQRLDVKQVEDSVKQDILPSLYESDFYSCVFTNTENRRKYFQSSKMYFYDPYNCEVYKNDLWTQDVLHELYRLKYPCTWGDVIPLPMPFAKYPLY